MIQRRSPSAHRGVFIPGDRRKLVLRVLIAFLAVLVVGSRSWAQSLQIEMEATGNPIAAGRVERCEQSAQTAVGAKLSWWIAFGDARPQAAGGWVASGAHIRSGPGNFTERPSSPQRAASAPYLVVDVRVSPLRLQNAILSLEVAISSRKLSGFSETGTPTYETRSERRVFMAEEAEDLFLPLMVADTAEKSAFDVREIVLNLKDGPPHRSGGAFGAVAIRGELPNADVLLDGGLVGRASAAGTLTLRNVPVGEREVRVRDGSGREARRNVWVRRDRTALVTLGQSAPPSAQGPPALVPSGKNAQGYQEYRRERDGAVMVMIPEGEFTMGNLETERQPFPHQVFLSPFLMDKTPVTWAQYKRFLEATDGALPPDEPYWGIHDDHPAAFVTWEEGRAFCEWSGARLPTEAEREKAARGTDTRKWPWGAEEPDPERGVYRHNWGYAATEPVATHPKGMSPYGLLDMGGNMWEWCGDWYDDVYYQTSPPRDPMGPPTGRTHVVRGGSWDSRPAVLSASCRNWGQFIGYREGDFGFRCASDPPR